MKYKFKHKVNRKFLICVLLIGLISAFLEIGSNFLNYGVLGITYKYTFFFILLCLFSFYLYKNDFLKTKNLKQTRFFSPLIDFNSFILISILLISSLICYSFFLYFLIALNVINSITIIHFLFILTSPIIVLVYILIKNIFIFLNKKVILSDSINTFLSFKFSLKEFNEFFLTLNWFKRKAIFIVISLSAALISELLKTQYYIDNTTYIIIYCIIYASCITIYFCIYNNFPLDLILFIFFFMITFMLANHFILSYCFLGLGLNYKMNNLHNHNVNKLCNNLTKVTGFDSAKDFLNQNITDNCNLATKFIIYTNNIINQSITNNCNLATKFIKYTSKLINQNTINQDIVGNNIVSNNNIKNCINILLYPYKQLLMACSQKSVPNLPNWVYKSSTLSLPKIITGSFKVELSYVNMEGPTNIRAPHEKSTVLETHTYKVFSDGKVELINVEKKIISRTESFYSKNPTIIINNSTTFTMVDSIRTVQNPYKPILMCDPIKIIKYSKPFFIKNWIKTSNNSIFENNNLPNNLTTYISHQNILNNINKKEFFGWHTLNKINIIYEEFRYYKLGLSLEINSKRYIPKSLLLHEFEPQNMIVKILYAITVFNKEVFPRILYLIDPTNRTSFLMYAQVKTYLESYDIGRLKLYINHLYTSHKDLMLTIPGLSLPWIYFIFSTPGQDNTGQLMHNHLLRLDQLHRGNWMVNIQPRIVYDWSLNELNHLIYNLDKYIYYDCDGNVIKRDLKICFEIIEERIEWFSPNLNELDLSMILGYQHGLSNSFALTINRQNEQQFEHNLNLLSFHKSRNMIRVNYAEILNILRSVRLRNNKHNILLFLKISTSTN